jgi:hypothetical protein
MTLQAHFRARSSRSTRTVDGVAISHALALSQLLVARRIALVADHLLETVAV